MRALLFLSIALSSTLSANGGLIIDVQDATMNAGGSQFVDVYITGDVGDTIGRFGYEFNISGATPQSGDLQFQLVQSKSEQQVIANPPLHQGYVFQGDVDQTFLTTQRGGNPTILLGDDTLATLNSVPVAGTYLLARLELQHVGPMSVPSSAFTISLNPTSPFTLFDRDFDVGTDTNYLPAELTTLSGTITVNAAAVPEPSSLAVIAVIAGIAGVYRRARKSTSIE